MSSHRMPLVEDGTHSQTQYVVAMTTSRPSTESELQQYRVLERANLLQYYDTFISQGGDDVRQLCEAGEEEFLEIMALVGMASKPLHVRRLQKALQEWVSNPVVFQQALNSPIQPASTQAVPKRDPITRHCLIPHHNPKSTMTLVQTAPLTVTMPTTSSSTVSGLWPLPTTPTLTAALRTPAADAVVSVTSSELSPVGSNGNKSADVSSLNGTGGQSVSPPAGSGGGYPYPPRLSEAQLWAIERVAADVARLLPTYEAKSVNPKKDVVLQELIDSTEDTPERLEKIRKYAAIYGRFDSKRKNDNNMSLHEVSVNEAAAQLCRHVATLLTRRNDLFPLARQVVRDSGYQYSKGRSRSQRIDIPSDTKKAKHGSAAQQTPDGAVNVSRAELEKLKRESRMSEIDKELGDVTGQQGELKARVNKAKSFGDTSLVHALQGDLESLTTRQLELLTEQSEIIKKQRCAQRQLWVKHQFEGDYFGESIDDDDPLNDVSRTSSPGNSDDEFDDPTGNIGVSTAHEDSAGSTIALQHTLSQEQLAGGATEGGQGEEALGEIVIKTEEWNREADREQATQGSVVVKQEAVLERENAQS